ncbi:hypothetical protein JMJ55_30245 [Belnapia sp. T6]|uniref:ATP-grasp domain-containing protein n=1 Tax=Belnapia mucosa TaxID=2804532 RepID=A0ABS1VD10_9PROT|nr:ATP-grasp fold amidoligase family protein [Belnapia mucosa]MBL6459587.1 hypothetical protein [Belnapia mucosa]
MALGRRERATVAMSSLIPDMDLLNFMVALPSFIAHHRRLPINPERDSASIDDLFFYRKLSNRSYICKTLADKHSGKLLARGILPGLSISHTYDVFSMENMDFSSFCRRLEPYFDKPLVAKPAHSSGGVLFLDTRPTHNLLRSTYEIAVRDYFFFSREAVYKNLTKRIIVEESLKREGVIPDDFKFFCANGEVLLCQVDRGRFTRHTRDLYECATWRWLPVSYRYPRSEEPIERPDKLEEMVQIAATLSRGFEFMRVDLYVVDNAIYFGEATFHPESAQGRFSDDTFGRDLLRRIREAALAARRI